MADEVSRGGFLLSYDGPALAAGSIDVRELAPALLSVGDLFYETNKVAGGRTDVGVHMRATRAGSFEVLLEIVLPLLPLAPEMNKGIRPRDLIRLLFGEPQRDGPLGLLGLIQAMRGEPLPPDRDAPALRDRRADSVVGVRSRSETAGEQPRERRSLSPEPPPPMPAQFNITIHGSPNITFRDLYNNTKIRKSVDGITKPLASTGIETMSIRSGPSEEPFVVIPKSDRECYESNGKEVILRDDVRTMELEIVSPIFRRRNRWRFHDGYATMYAYITDERFWTDVDEGESGFRKGDVLICEVRSVETSTRVGKLRVIHTIPRVLEHIPRNERH